MPPGSGGSGWGAGGAEVLTRPACSLPAACTLACLCWLLPRVSACFRSPRTVRTTGSRAQTFPCFPCATSTLNVSFSSGGVGGAPTPGRLMLARARRGRGGQRKAGASLYKKVLCGTGGFVSVFGRRMMETGPGGVPAGSLVQQR